MRDVKVAPFTIYRNDFQHAFYHSINYNNIVYGHRNDKIDPINRQKYESKNANLIIYIQTCIRIRAKFIKLQNISMSEYHKRIIHIEFGIYEISMSYLPSYQIYQHL